MLKLTGIIIPNLTPMDAAGQELHLDAVEPLVTFLVDRKVDALFVGGTTGEGPLLRLRERQEHAEAVIAAAAGRLPVVVQVGAATTRDSIELARHAAAAGADAVACMTPTFFAYDISQLEHFYLELARAVAPLALYLYDIPARTGNPIPLPLVERLSHEPNIVGIKDSSGEMARLLELLTIPDFVVVPGADLLAALALQGGASGMVSGPAGVLPEPYVALWRAHRNGDAAAMLQWQTVIMEISRLVRHGARIDILKALMARRVPGIGSVRPPLSPPAAVELDAVRAGLKRVLAATTLPPAAHAWL